MNYGNRIVKMIKINDFIDILKEYPKEKIECTGHTFFRLSQKQRKIYTPDELIKILKEENPILAGLQKNGNYAIFYKYKNKHLKIILGINPRKINIVTFYFIKEWQLLKL